MENLERQLEEIEVLEAIYPDELTIDADSIKSARQLLENYNDGSSDDDGNSLRETRLSFTIKMARLASLEPSGKLKHIHPSVTIEFPQDYPETSPPIITKTSGLDDELNSIVRACLEDHSGEESMMQLVMSINEQIQTRSETTVENYETGIREREKQKAKQSESTQPGTDNAQEKNACSVPVIGRRIINSPYILKPAKIKDIKKCADELKLGGYAKTGKPGIIVIEGPEEGCQQYCPTLEDRGWKYQKVRGEQKEEGPTGGTVDELRKIKNGTSGFEVLGEDATVSDLGKLCKEAGLGDLFFESLNIHDSSAKGGNKGSNHKDGSGRKSGKR